MGFLRSGGKPVATLTKRIIDAAKLAPGTSTFGTGNSPVSGEDNPRAKVFLVQYRPRGRDSRGGSHSADHGSPLTVDMAGGRPCDPVGCSRWRDPQAERQGRKGSISITDIAIRWLAEHVATKRKPRTLADYRRLLELHVLPSMG